MEQQIKMPNPAQRLYTEEDYRLAMQRAAGDAELAQMMEETRGCGFGFLYMDYVHRALDTKNNKELREWQQRVDELEQQKEADADITCNLLNSQFDNVRRHASKKLNDYAYSRGCIDAWPSPLVSAGVTKYGRDENGKTDGVHINFGFFSEDFTYRRQGDTNLIYRKKGHKLHSYYSSLERPKELVWAEARASELRRVKAPTKAQRRISILKWFAARIPMVLMLLIAVLFLVGALNGVDEKTLQSILPENGFLHFFAAMYVFMISSEMVFFIMLPGMVISGLILTDILKLILAADWISKEEVEKGIKAKEELARLENDPRYPQMDREYRERCTLERKQVEAWQAQWYAVCKEKGYFM